LLIEDYVRHDVFLRAFGHGVVLRAISHDVVLRAIGHDIEMYEELVITLVSLRWRTMMLGLMGCAFLDSWQDLGTVEIW
jgi:hypothetical protein